MLWLADVLTGTTSQQWNERYRAPVVKNNGSKRSRSKRISVAAHGGLRYLRDWFQRRRATHALSQLSDHLLHDIGIDRAQIAEYVRNSGHVTFAESTLAREASVGEHRLDVVPGPGPIVQQCVDRSKALSCANDEMKRVA